MRVIPITKTILAFTFAAARGRIYLTGKNGAVQVTKDADTFESISVNKLDEQFPRIARDLRKGDTPPRPRLSLLHRGEMMGIQMTAKADILR